MSYIRMSDLGQTPAPRPASRNPTVAEKVAITNLVKQIETARSVRAAWEGYQDFIANTRPFNGWSDSCSNGFFSSCPPPGEYDTLHSLVARVGQVIGGFTQVMSFASLGEMLTNVQREIAAVRPGGRWDPTESAVARTLVSIMSPGAGIIMYFVKPQTASESVGQVQNAYSMWQQLAIIARDSGRITADQYATLRTRADPAFRSLTTAVVNSNRAGSAVDNALTSPPTISDAAKFIECLMSSKGPVDVWNCLPTWGKVAVGVVGASAVAAPVVYAAVIFGPAIRAAGNVAEGMTRKNGRRR